MRVSIKTSLLMLALCFAGKSLKAQVDPHFSQYYVYPSWLNPALTGAFDGDYRIAGIHRSQWGNITTPFSTQGVAADFNTNKTMNFGGSILNQSAGDGGYNYTTAYVNGAYTGLRFGVQGYQRLVFGMQLGMIQRKFNPTKLKWGNQWNPSVGFDSNIGSGETFKHTVATSFDAGAGLMYYDAQPGKKSNFFGGVSVAHLNMPEDKFSVTSTEKLPMRFTAHAGMRFNINPTFSITPNALLLKQGTATETMIGAYAQLKAAPDADVLLGANYRFNDALSPYAGFYYKNMVIGLTYDVNTSDLGKVAKGSNSFEISLTFIGRKKTKTPETEFICPRL